EGPESFGALPRPAQKKNPDAPAVTRVLPKIISGRNGGRSPRPLRLCEPNHTFPACPGLDFHLLVTDLVRREGRHGKRLFPRRAGEEPRPASAPKRSPRRGRHLHFDMLGGPNNQN